MKFSIKNWWFVQTSPLPESNQETSNDIEQCNQTKQETENNSSVNKLQKGTCEPISCSICLMCCCFLLCPSDEIHGY